MESKNRFNRNRPKKNESEKRKSGKSDLPPLLYGKHCCLAALQNNQRQIEQIFISKNNEADLRQFLKEKKINFNNNLIKVIDGKYFANILPEGAVHQGFALKCSDINTTDFNDFYGQIARLEAQKLPQLLILDNLTDPHNIGAIIRSAGAFGFEHIIFSGRNCPINSPVVAKTACGVLEIVNLISGQNLNNLLDSLKKLGYWRLGLAGEGTDTISAAQNYQPIALILGSEGAGIRRLVKENCDLLVKIPIATTVESLNASNAAAIAMYEISKK